MNNNNRLLCFGILAMILTGCGGSSVPQSEIENARANESILSNVPSNEIDANLSPMLSATERTIMRAELATLPVSLRANVVVIGPDRHVYANRPGLRDAVFTFEATATPDIYYDPTTARNIHFFLHEIDGVGTDEGEASRQGQIKSANVTTLPTGYAHSELSPQGNNYFSGTTLLNCANTMIAGGQSADIIRERRQVRRALFGRSMLAFILRILQFQLIILAILMKFRFLQMFSTLALPQATLLA